MTITAHRASDIILSALQDHTVAYKKIVELNSSELNALETTCWLVMQYASNERQRRSSVLSTNTSNYNEEAIRRASTE